MHQGCPHDIRPWSVWYSTELLEPFRIPDICDISITVRRPTEAPFVVLKRITRSQTSTNVQQFASALPGLSRTFNKEQSGSSVLTSGLVGAGQVAMAVIPTEEKQISCNRLILVP